MSVIDVSGKTITLKVVYYGCALGGKTTNLETLHRMTDPEGRHGLLSIATQDDRTLFFDLLPMELGHVGGMKVRVKVYTVPGQVHYELTRRQVLAGADGVVFVADSTPEARKANAWAIANLRDNLKANGLDPARTPTVLQWNKRDLEHARPVDEMESELNPRGLPAIDSVATSGTGVIETFSTVLQAALHRAYVKAGRASVPKEEIVGTVERALAEARSRRPPAASESAFEHRVDMEAYQDKWAERGRDRKVMDHETLLSESVQTSMELAERLDGLREVQAVSRRRAAMLGTLAELGPELLDPTVAAVPAGVMRRLLAGSGRSHGSLLLFRPGESTMQEQEVVPDGRDCLNAAEATGLGSTAYRLAEPGEPRHVEDLATEVFFDATPPRAESLACAYLAPLRCDRVAFGCLVAYGRLDEAPIDPSEREFWDAASRFLSLSLHWKALRRKLAGESGSARAAG